MFRLSTAGLHTGPHGEGGYTLYFGEDITKNGTNSAIFGVLHPHSWGPSRSRGQQTSSFTIAFAAKVKAIYDSGVGVDVDVGLAAAAAFSRAIGSGSNRCCWSGPWSRSCTSGNFF